MLGKGLPIRTGMLQIKSVRKVTQILSLAQNISFGWIFATCGGVMCLVGVPPIKSVNPHAWFSLFPSQLIEYTASLSRLLFSVIILICFLTNAGHRARKNNTVSGLSPVRARLAWTKFIQGLSQSHSSNSLFAPLIKCFMYCLIMYWLLMWLSGWEQE